MTESTHAHESTKLFPQVQRWLHNRSRDLNIITGVLAAGVGGYIAWENSNEVHCLAKNIIHEAQFEPQKGQEAVALVTLLRRLSDTYPDSLCGVVFDNTQFSWTTNPQLVNENVYERLTQPIADIATRMYRVHDDAEAIQNEARKLGLTMDTYFYKRTDWDEYSPPGSPAGHGLSENSKWFFTQCLEPVSDKDGNDVIIGAHKFYRPRAEVCPRRPPGGITQIPLPVRNPKRTTI